MGFGHPLKSDNQNLIYKCDKVSLRNFRTTYSLNLKGVCTQYKVGKVIHIPLGLGRVFVSFTGYDKGTFGDDPEKGSSK